MFESCSEYLGENEKDVLDWDVGQVVKWAKAEKLHGVVELLQDQDIDGRALLMLTDRDLESRLTIGTRKNLLLAIRQLHRTSNYATLDFLGLLDAPLHNNHHQSASHLLDLGASFSGNAGGGGGTLNYAVPGSGHGSGDIDRISPASSTVSGRAAAVSTKPEVFKTFVSVGE